MRTMAKLMLTVAATLAVVSSASNCASAQPVPATSISAPSTPLLNDPVPVTVGFLNSSSGPNDIGYYPMVEVRLPAAFECDASCRAGITVENPPGSVAALTHCGGAGAPSGSCINPVTGEAVSYSANETVMFMTLPTGTVSVGQPSVLINIPATMTASAVVGTPFSVRSRGMFALGAIANGTRGSCGSGAVDTVCETLQSYSVTPIVLTIDKTESPATYSATGPTHPRTYSVVSNVATSASVSGLTITDTVPSTLIITSRPSNCGGAGAAITPAPTSCTFSVDPSGGGSLSATFANVTGVSGDDITISYSAYVQELDPANSNSPIISPVTGATTTVTNTASAAYTYSAQALSTSDSITIQQPSLVTAKSASVTDATANGTSPGDTVTWTVKAKLSDYFSFDDLAFTDTIEDGQTYVNGSFQVRVIEGASDITKTQAQLGAYVVISAEVGGARSVALNLSGALVDAGVFARDGVLDGADIISAGVSTEVIITYQTTIDETFDNAPGGGGNTTIVDGGDVLSNTGTYDFEILGQSNRRTPPATASVTVQPLQTILKTIAYKNGGAPGSPTEAARGDALTYRIRVTIPTGDLEDFSIQDFLPTPLFRSTDPTATVGSGASPATLTYSQDAQGDAAPAAGHWRFTTSSAVTPAVILVGVKSDNSLEMDLSAAVEDNSSSVTQVLEFLFTVTGTNEPMADDLQLVNVLFAQHGNSASDSVVELKAASSVLQTDSPKLVVTKTAQSVVSGDGTVSSGNFTGVDAETALRFQVLIENVGSEKAWDVTLLDTLPTGLARPGTGYNLSINGAGCNVGGLDSSASGPSTFTFSGVTIDQGATCTLTYDVTVTNAAPLGATLTNRATVTYASEAGGPTFSPESDNATTTIKSVGVAKAYQNGTSSDAVTADKNLRPGEAVDFRITVTVPEGTATNFSLREVDSGTSNPAADFFETLAQGNFTLPVVEQNCSNANPSLFNFQGLTDVCFTLNPSLVANQSASAEAYVINFGTVINLNTSDAATESFQITVRPTTKTLKAGGVYTNRAVAQWTAAGSPMTQTGTDTFTLQNPTLTFTKVVDVNSGVKIGDTLRYTITVTNTGNVPAYSVSPITDAMWSGPASVSLVSATYQGASVVGDTGFSFTYASGSVQVTVRNGAGAATIAQGHSFVVIYDVVVGGTRVTDTTAGPGHPGGVAEGPGCASSVTNDAELLTFKTGPGGGDPTINLSATSSATSNLDSDGDGVANSVETAGGCADSDGDGVENHLDTDSDDNGIADGTEYSGGADRDGDGVPNYKDTDDDADSRSDWNEIQDVSGNPATDSDGDGVPNFRDADSDNDGVPDVTEGAGDLDGDGIPNYLDLDADNDGVVDLVEAGGTDSNNDGRVDNATDNDGDGLANIVDSNLTNATVATTTLPVPNTDGTGSADFLDIDADDDGITDTIEFQSTAGYVSPSGVDTDGDGWDNAYDSTNGGTALSPVDTDGDSTPDYRDTDSDNDSVSDRIEGSDANHDGVSDVTFSGTDSDNDGLDNAFDTFNLSSPPGSGLNATGSNAPLQDTDADSKRDWRDVDDDNDGIPTTTETTSDVDGDGKPNYLDLDADGDGLFDITEAGGVDANLNGRPDSLVDTDGDGLVDLVDASNGGTAYTLPNTDTVGGADYLDTDSDNDGIFDNVEGQSTAGFIARANADADGDGIDNAYDSDQGGTPFAPYNKDAADMPDYRDTDSDNDTLLDSVEGTGNPDGDAEPNFRDIDSDGDGILDSVETAVDTDGDSTPNYLDADSDNDGISDQVEATRDTDGDSTPDRLELDSDGDGIPDSVEGVTDTDGDGIPNYRDLDSDNDGVPDSVEGATDFDGDGIPNYRDLDSDNDGIADVVEAGGADVNGDGLIDDATDTDGDGLRDVVDPSNGGTPLLDPDSDRDGRPNRLDLDSDNDGIADIVEAGGTDANRDGQADSAADANANGWSDTFDKPVGGTPLVAPDTDGDGFRDYLDIDADADGIVDTIEAQGETGVILPSGIDSDGDGLDNAYDSSNGGALLVPVNTDGDSLPDYRDLDSENDGVPDRIEGSDSNFDGLTDVSITTSDSDQDGLADAFDIVDFLTNHNWGVNAVGSNAPLQNRDQTDSRDWRDTDDDNDRIPTVAEDVNLNGTYSDDDVDGDTIPNYLDGNPLADRDDDGVSDADEATAQTDPCDSDTDDDGLGDGEELAPGADGKVTNPLDADSDDDGLSDGDELNLGTNPLDSDSDDDGLTDGIEKGVTIPIPGGLSDCSSIPYLGTDVAAFVPDLDPATTSDPLDADTDDDGASDGSEDANHDGAVSDGETDPRLGLSSCGTTSLVETKGNMDGTVLALSNEVTRAVRERSKRQELCGTFGRAKQRRTLAAAQNAYQDAWTTIWQQFVNVHFVCDPLPSELCVYSSTADAKANVTDRTKELKGLVKSTLGQCTTKSSKGREIWSRAKRFATEIANYLQNIPDPTLYCPTDQ